MGVLAYIVTVKKGYALCDGSATTEQEAADFIAKNGSPVGVR